MSLRVPEGESLWRTERDECGTQPGGVSFDFPGKRGYNAITFPANSAVFYIQLLVKVAIKINNQKTHYSKFTVLSCKSMSLLLKAIPERFSSFLLFLLATFKKMEFYLLIKKKINLLYEALVNYW